MDTDLTSAQTRGNYSTASQTLRVESLRVGLLLWNLGWLDSDRTLVWVSRVFSIICVCRSCCSSTLLKLLVWTSIIWLEPEDRLVLSALNSAVTDSSWSCSTFVHLTCPFLCPRSRLDSALLMASRAMARCVAELKLPGSSFRSVYLISLSNIPSMKASLLAASRPATSRWALAASPNLRTRLENSWTDSDSDFWRFLNLCGHSLRSEKRRICC